MRSLSLNSQLNNLVTWFNNIDWNLGFDYLIAILIVTGLYQLANLGHKVLDRITGTVDYDKLLNSDEESK